MKRLVEEKNLIRDRFSGFVVFSLCLIVVILSVTRVFVANRLVELSDNFRRLDKEVTQLESENQTLAEQIRTYESITNLETKVVELGFEQTKRFTYLTPPNEIAYLR